MLCREVRGRLDGELVEGGRGDAVVYACDNFDCDGGRVDVGEAGRARYERGDALGDLGQVDVLLLAGAFCNLHCGRS